MILSTRTKESIKTALAMTIAYGIALQMDWDKPYWAGFAVAFISLSTVGQSLNKGAMRMLGTLFALVVSLLIIALFVQDRWLFMAALSGWIGFCTYRMGVSKRSYFWFLAGFASAVIAFDGGTDPINAFDIAVLRAEETGLGVLAYTLVTTLLWPTNSCAEFKDATRALAQAQHQLYVSYREMLTGHRPEPGQDTQASTVQPVQSLAQFGGTLDAALADTYEVWEQRDQWRRFRDQSATLFETLNRLYESREVADELELNVLPPNFKAATAELELRFVEIEGLLAGEPLQHQPQPIDLSLDYARLHELPHFHKAAFTIARTRLQHIDKQTREQFDTVLEIKGLAASSAQGSVPQPAVPPAPSDKSWPGLLPDTDNMIAAVRAMASLWLAYLLWIYVEVPGGTSIVMAGGTLGMIFATNPRLSALIIIKPVLLTITVAGTLYIFVMPQLSSFAGLGTMMFLYVCTTAYLFSTPKQGISRAISLAIFVIIIGVSNSSQQYNLLSVVDTALMLLLAIGVIVVTSLIPFSMQPDKAFLRLLRRFFHSSEYLMTTMRWDRTTTTTRMDCWKRAFHAREVATLPRKLSDWGKVVDTGVLPGTTPEQLQALTTNLQALAYRMQEFLNARANPQAELLVRELLTDIRAWHLKVQGVFQRLSQDPAAGEQEAFRTGLDTAIKHLEVRIRETMDKAPEGRLSIRDDENFYHLLGAYRGISDALVDYAGSAGNINWARWREERFA
jgi:uncharacterized membrane protein YccC